ncbi:hypothetical protein RYX36_009553 [Vicia faba]
MVDLEIAFKVKWQPDWKNCSVVMILRDRAVINQLKAPWAAEVPLNSQPIDTPALQIKENVDEVTTIDECDALTIMVLCVLSNIQISYVIVAYISVFSLCCSSGP